MTPYSARKAGREITRHHLTPKVLFKRQGKPVDNSTANILLIYRDKHEVWHKLFGERDLRGAIELLQRVERMKKRRR